MSPLFLLLVGFAALATPSLAQKRECPLPCYPNASKRPRSPPRSTRQVQPPTTDASPTTIPTQPYSNCGAVVVSDRFLLTAAYCVMNPYVTFNTVRLGDLDLSQEGEPNSRPADYDIEFIILHPNVTHNPETGIRYHDLALLRTDRQIEFNDVVYPYCISRDRPAPGTIITASGFGYVNETHKASHLQEGELQVMALSECEAEYRAKGKEALLKEAYPGSLQGSGVLCAGHPKRGLCKGDEGGPLLRVDESGCHFLEGIISFTGDVCGPDVLPSMSVSIADYYDFISDTINSF